MHITCPGCASTFDVPMTVMGPSGRKFRCPRCGHVWHVASAGDPLPFSGPPDVAAPLADQTPPPVFSGQQGASSPQPVSVPPADDMAVDDSPSSIAGQGDGPPRGARSSDKSLEDLMEDLDTALRLAGHQLSEARRKSSSEGADFLAVWRGEKGGPVRDGYPERREPVASHKGPYILIGCVTVFVLVWLVALGGYVFRNQLVHDFPGLIKAYNTLGIAVGSDEKVRIRLNDQGQQDIQVNWVGPNDGPILKVSITLVNPTTDRVLPVPGLVVVLLGEDGVNIQQTTLPPAHITLKPGETVDLDVLMENPSPLGRRVRIDLKPQAR